jgi:hypothetical protein
MLKFLGRQYLGQTDQPQTIVSVLETDGVYRSGLSAEQQKDLERLYAGILKRALARTKRETETEDWDWLQRRN